MELVGEGVPWELHLARMDSHMFHDELRVVDWEAKEATSEISETPEEGAVFLLCWIPWDDRGPTEAASRLLERAHSTTAAALRRLRTRQAPTACGGVVLGLRKLSWTEAGWYARLLPGLIPVGDAARRLDRRTEGAGALEEGDQGEEEMALRGRYLCEKC